MDLALDKGINFFDMAELNPVPSEEHTYAETERIIGNWFQKTGHSDKVVLASKIADFEDYSAYIRTNGFCKESLEDAVCQSPKRLKTDYIDFFQLHWPERNINSFGIRDYRANPEEQWQDNFNEILHAFDGIIKSRKIRHIGISNEKA